MAIRKIVHIDEEKCNGCGLCIPSCEEGAIQIINGKAKLLRDDLCDGLGNCLGECPQDAIKIIERDAEEFNEEAVHEHLKKIEKNNLEKIESMKSHKLSGGCPGSRAIEIQRNQEEKTKDLIGTSDVEIHIKPQLKQWPVQLSLVPTTAPYFREADLLVTADCVPFAYADYHLDLLKGKTVVIGCPKLDDVSNYEKKLIEMIQFNNFKSITVAYMEVPCCGGIVRVVEQAIAKSNVDISLQKVCIGLNGNKK